MSYACLLINFPEIITVRMNDKVICEHRHKRRGHRLQTLASMMALCNRVLEKPLSP